MRERGSATALALVAVATGAGCLSYSGGAHATDPARFTSEPGWIVAGDVPALRQRGANDCGAAALAMVATRWQLDLSVADAVAALPVATSEGSGLGELRALARARGLTAFAVVADRDTLLHELDAGRPVIVGLFAPYGPRYVQRHYEVVVAARPADGQFATIDPARGWRLRSWTDLEAEWRPAGYPALVVLGPAPAGAQEPARDSRPPRRP